MTTCHPGGPATGLPLIFLGPSLAQAEAQRLCQGEYRGPIRRGDLVRYAGSAPRVIGIIDGAFHHSLTVSPREVQEAIASGHRVYGAASIGALRAVELGFAGMIGVGRVYAAFASGAVERDDEVAVAFDPETGRALSEALIGMRVAFQEACSAGVLDKEEMRAAIDVAAGLHYPLRTYRRVVGCLDISPERRARLLQFLQTEAPDLKAEDARELLRRVAGDKTALPPRLRTPRRRWLSAAYGLAPRPGLPATGPALRQLPPAPKVAGWTSVRTVTAAETNARLALVRGRYGVTRVADITGLDTLGIPCFSAILPGSLAGSGISAYSGKSLDPMEARVGAQVEALEGALVRDARVPMRRACYADLVQEVQTLDPERLQIIGTERRDLRRVELDWIPGWSLHSGETTWVPADTVFFRPGPKPPWHLSSNGQAAGNCLTEALAHALAEAIERDAETLYRVTSVYAHLPHTLQLLAGPARVPCPPEHHTPPTPWYPFVDCETLPEPLRSTVRRVQQAGATLELRWITSEVQVPAFLCLIQERHGPEAMLHAGAGAHPDATVAARRAITEAAQSRATYIHGVREDLRNGALRSQEIPNGGWYDPATQRVDFAALPSHPHDDVVEDLRYMVDALERAGLNEVLVVDISHPAVPFSVARVIVPGLEAPLDVRDRDRLALGWRARRFLDHVVKAVPAMHPPGAAHLSTASR